MPAACTVLLVLALSLASPVAASAAPLPVGYQPRACGFDLNDDGILGDPAHDCDLCDGVTTDPDGDGIDEDLLYIDADAGSDETGDGSPALPYRTIQFAWNQADGPDDGAEDILCFRGVAEEEEIVPGTSGVPGVRTKTASGNEARDWEFPANPTMLVGWDSDNDGEYPPVDTDDVAVLDGAGNHVDTGLIRALRIGAENSYLEVAHFTARDYGRYVPVQTDENGHIVDALDAGFVKFTTGRAGIGSHIYLHDLSIENINMDTVGGSHRITFDFFIGHTILHYLAMINLDIPNTSSFMNRGSAPALPGLGRDGRDYGPVRWQNLSVTAHGKDEAPGVLGGFYLGWKLWGYMTGLEILDSVFDANLDQWNVGTQSVDFVNATQCSRDWTIRNNLLLDIRDALTAQGGNGDFCTYDLVNDPPKQIPRTTDDVVFEDNVFINQFPQQTIPVQIKGGDDPQRSVEDVTIDNNLFVTFADEGFGWCIKAGAANDTGPGNPGRTVVANNTCYGHVEEDGDRGAIVVGDIDRPAAGQQDDVLIANNLIAGMGDNGPRNIEMIHVPAALVLDTNVYDPRGVFARPGLFTDDLAVWQAGSGQDAGSVSCVPAFVDLAGADLRLAPYDACARNAGSDLSGWIPGVDLDGVARPQQTQWDIGAYETLEPPADAAPIRYAGAPVSELNWGTTTATLSLRTYRAATCRWDALPGTSYALMAETFTSSDGLAHEYALAGLGDGNDYVFFVRCDDGVRANDDDYEIAFSVEPTPVTDLVAHWAMNENIGTDAADVTGNGNDAVLLNGGAWTPGVVGSALELDGTNDWLLVEDPGSNWILDIRDALTIAAWVRPASVGTQMKIVSKDNIFEFQIGQAGSGRVSLRLNNAGGGVADTAVTAGQWQHLVATWDGQTVAYYRNGVPDGTSAFAATLNANNLDIGLGARPPGNNFLQGAIDEVRIYDGALGAAEVLELFNDRELPPDTEAPLRGEVIPASALPVGTTEATVGLHTNEAATCRWSATANTAYDSMADTLATSDGLLHTTDFSGLADGGHYEIFVRCRDAGGQINDDEFALRFSVLRPTPEDFTPAALADLRFYIQSTVFEDEATRARSIATCNTEACFTVGNGAPIEQQYCDTTQFPGGCIRRWDDLSGYLPLGGFRPPEWVRGRNFGQDDLEKPLFVSDCVNGHPCARGGTGAQAPDGSPLPQNFSFEIEVEHAMSLPGAFSIFHLVRPVVQAEDYQYFGLNGLIHLVADDSLAYRTSATTVRLTGADAVTNGAWQLLEIHRDAEGRLSAFINGTDVTWNTPLATGDAAAGNYLSRFKGDSPMLGDLAAHLAFARHLEEQEILDIRAYLQGIYDYESSVPVDTAAPLASHGSPTGQLEAGTIEATLSVQTDEAAECRFSDSAGTAFDDMAGIMATIDGLTHEGAVADLRDGLLYTFHVRCRDLLGNTATNDYEISFYIGEPGTAVGLLAHWPFEEGAGGLARNNGDASLDGALVNGASWVAGVHGLAMSFDGTNQHAVIDDTGADNALDATGGLSISVWVRPETLPDFGVVKLLAKDNAYEFEIGHAGPRMLSVRLNNARQGRADTPVAAGTWQHLAVTWDGATVTYYRDGQPDGTAAFTGPLVPNDNDAGIAARPLGSIGSGHFHGALDELRLYDRALAPAEVAELARAPLAAVECPALPAENCREPLEARKSLLKLSARDDGRDKLVWKWTRGAETTLADIGNPATDDDYALCLYDSLAGSGRLLLQHAMPAAAECGSDRPCWKQSSKGTAWRDARLMQGPIKKMAIRAGAGGKPRITLAAQGPALALPELPLSVDPWIRLQLHNTANGRCWEGRYEDVTVRGGARLKARSR